MALRTQTTTLPFRDSEGNPTEASFVIRERLSHDGLSAYLVAVQRVARDGDGNVDLDALQESRKLMVAGGLLGSCRRPPRAAPRSQPCRASWRRSALRSNRSTRRPPAPPSA